MDTIFNAVKELKKKPAIALVLILALLFSDPYSALAASGGRMGGRCSSTSLSHSSPSSSSTSSSSPSHGSFYSYSSRSYSSTTSYPKSNKAAGNSSSSSSGSDFDSTLFSDLCTIVLVLLVISFVIAGIYYSFYDHKTVRAINYTTTVLKLQVGLLGSARSLQRDLNEIAETTDTSTSKGLSYILTETVVALLRNPDYFASAFSSGDVITSYEGAEKRFNELSIEERGQLDEETLVNVNNIRRQRPTSKRDDGSSNDYIVITILLEAGGSHKLPVINGCKDYLKDALQKLGSIPCSQIRAVEVIWTPQDENETLSEEEVVEDYPLLKPIF